MPTAWAFYYLSFKEFWQGLFFFFFFPCKKQKKKKKKCFKSEILSPESSVKEGRGGGFNPNLKFQLHKQEESVGSQLADLELHVHEV